MISLKKIYKIEIVAKPQGNLRIIADDFDAGLREDHSENHSTGSCKVIKFEKDANL